MPTAVLAMKRYVQHLAAVIVAWFRVTHRVARVEDAVDPVGALPTVDQATTDETPETVAIDRTSAGRSLRRRLLAALREHQHPPTVEWEFRRDILERLDEYFYCLDRLRTYDPDGYHLLSRTSMSIPATGLVNPERSDIDAQVIAWPRVGCGGVLYPTAEKPGTVTPSFIYFKKLTMASRVQYAQGAIYAVTLLFDNRKSGRERLLLPVRCHVAVDGASVVLLREARVIQQRFDRRAGNRKERVETGRVEWRYPAAVEELALDMGRAWPSVEAYVRAALLTAFGTYIEANAKIVIRVHQAGRVASFGIPLPRCPRFFRDRDATVLAADGKRKRIFHAVTQHVRQTQRWGAVDVRAHYRGIRQFLWRTYDVHIVFPTNDPRSFNIPMTYTEDLSPSERRRYYGARTVGRMVARIFDA